LPADAGFQLPPSSGAFGYSEARIVAQSAIVNMELLNRYKSQKILEAASALSTKDSRDVVTFAVGSAFFQVVASQARLDTTDAALSSAQELQRQVADQYNAELSPEIDSIRAQVELKTAEQRVVDATNDLEKDKLTLDRITGLSLQQAWTPSHVYPYTPVVDLDAASSPISQTRSDLASIKMTVSAAQFEVKAAKAERMPVVSFEADYGGAGTNPAKFTQVYTVTGGVSVPLFTSGRIRSDVGEAQSALVQKRAEYRDLQGRVEYDRQVAMLDVKSSESAVKVAATNDALAQRALTQSQDRFQNGVTNYLEVVQAEATLVAAKENSIASLFSYNVAKISLARALGSTESRLPALFNTK
jgi:outer membrane protein TolC